MIGITMYEYLNTLPTIPEYTSYQGLNKKLDNCTSSSFMCTHLNTPCEYPKLLANWQSMQESYCLKLEVFHW